MAGVAYLLILNKTTTHLHKIFQEQNELVNKNNTLLKELESRTNNLIISAKKASLGDIASGMAHEINNPLAYIVSSIELLKIKKEISHDEIQKVFDKILLHCVRIGRIIKSLSYFSRKNIYDFWTHENLFDLINNSLSIQKESLRASKIKLELLIPKSLQIECNAYDLGIVALNLVKNSQEAISQNDDKWIRIEALDQIDHIFIKFIDSGHGIQTHILPYIMQPFFSTKNSLESQGMGLAIAQEIIQSHKGDLQIDTKQQNTTFVVRLPKKQSLTAQNQKHGDIYEFKKNSYCR